MNCEATRLNSFQNWTPPIDKHALAMFGFYHSSDPEYPDCVKCNFCGIEIGSWDEDDSVPMKHLTLSPYCPFMRSHPTDNVPMDDQLLRERFRELTESIRDEDEEWEDEDASQDEEEDLYIYDDADHETYNSRSEMLMSDFLRFFGAAFIHPAQPTATSLPSSVFCPKYMVELERLKSYLHWPKGLPQRPEELSAAGFYYTGTGDKVVCFSCGIEVDDWMPGEAAWDKHGQMSRNCQYFTQMNKPARDKPRKTTVVKEAEHDRSHLLPDCNSNTKWTQTDDENAEPQDDDKLCKMCFENEYDTAFLPCGHVSSCVKCAFSVISCPVCRKPYEKIEKIYLP